MRAQNAIIFAVDKPVDTVDNFCEQLVHNLAYPWGVYFAEVSRFVRFEVVKGIGA